MAQRITVAVRGLSARLVAPTLSFAGDHRALVGRAEIIRPMRGLTLIPSWFTCPVRHDRGTGTRIAIAVNLGL